MEAMTPAWIPGRLFWAYLMGAALIACGACIVVNKKVRLAATYLGIVVLLLGVFVYSLMIIANPSDIDRGLNNFVDILALSGTALVLADAISKRSSHQVSA
jgi:drug/metabolite transporter (DMT)-like permease